MARAGRRGTSPMRCASLRGPSTHSNALKALLNTSAASRRAFFFFPPATRRVSRPPIPGSSEEATRPARGRERAWPPRSYLRWRRPRRRPSSTRTALPLEGNELGRNGMVHTWRGSSSFTRSVSIGTACPRRLDYLARADPRRGSIVVTSFRRRLFVTNPSACGAGHGEQSAMAILIKVNHIGTLPRRSTRLRLARGRRRLRYVAPRWARPRTHDRRSRLPLNRTAARSTARLRGASGRRISNQLPAHRGGAGGKSVGGAVSRLETPSPVFPAVASFVHSLRWSGGRSAPAHQDPRDDRAGLLRRPRRSRRSCGPGVDARGLTFRTALTTIIAMGAPGARDEREVGGRSR